MIVKKINTRIQNKYDLKENWDTVADFVPLSGELIIVAPNTNTPTPGSVYANVPQRLKIGDGQHKARELRYIGMPEVKLYDSELAGFESVTLLPAGNANLHLHFNCEATHNKHNYEPQEFIQHKLFAQVLNERFIYITLSITGDGSNSTDGIKASDINVVFMPSKCALPTWHTGNTVSASQIVLPEYTVTETTELSIGTLTYRLVLPEDKDAAGKYLYNNGTFSINISCFLNKTSKEDTFVDIFIENEYLTFCPKSISTIK